MRLQLGVAFLACVSLGHFGAGFGGARPRRGEAGRGLSAGACERFQWLFLGLLSREPALEIMSRC